MKKRIFALLLALVMCLSLLPTAAFAEDDTDTTTGTDTTITDTTGDPHTGECDTTDTTDTTDTSGKSDTTDDDTAAGDDGADDSDGDTTDTTDSDTTDEDGEDADKDSNSIEGAPVPTVQSAGTPMVTALPGAAPVILASTGTHTNHKNCGNASCTGNSHYCSTTTWTEWSSTDSLPTGGGSYYLTGNVTISSTWKPSSTSYQKTTTNLCLNGYTITYTGTTESPAIEIQSGIYKLILCDCKDTGKIVHNGNKGGSVVQAKGSFTMYGGTITRGDNAGSGVKVESGSFTMYDGTITGNRSSGTIAGSGVYVAPGGKFTMSGGKITNNRGTYNGSNTYGGGVFVAAYPHYGYFSMSGGTIGGTGEDDGNSANYGGGVYIESNTQDATNVFHMTMAGGTITGNSADQGGGVLVDLYGVFKMIGGTITQNEAEENGGGLYVKSNTITVDENAKITGNKMVGLGTASGGKENNVYLPNEYVYITVNSGFTGAVGLNVDAEYWGMTPLSGTTSIGANWEAVKGDGRSSAISSNKVTYDGGEFTIDKNTGKLSCLHICDAEYNSYEGRYECKRCSTHVIIKTEFRNSAGNILKTQHYTDARTAFDAAVDNCVITLLGYAPFNSDYTWNLNSGAVTIKVNNGTALNSDASHSFIITNGTLNLNYEGSTTGERFCRMVVGTGATVNVNVTTYTTFGGSPSLTVQSGGKLVFNNGGAVSGLTVESGGTAEIKGGTFNSLTVQGTATLTGGTFTSITVADNMTCNDLLATGYAYFKNNTPTNGNGTTLSDVTVGSHTSCTFNEENHGVCPCGRECAHSDIDKTTGKCTGCTMQMVAKVTKNGEADSYYTTFNAALEGVRGAKNTDKATLTLLENTNLSADVTLPGGVYIIELNGKTLGNSTGNSYVLTADSNGAATIQDTVGGGKIDCTLKCTVVGNNSLNITGGSFARLEMAVGSTNGTGWPQISGGKFDEIVRTSSRTCRVINLLAPDYALKYSSDTGSYIRADAVIPKNDEVSDKFTNVEVVTPCEHPGMTQGADCPYCGNVRMVELTTYSADGSVLSCDYYTQLHDATTALTVFTETRTTLKLLKNVTAYGFTYNGAVPLTLDLNGKNLNSPITVGTTSSLTITGSGTVNDAVTVNGGTVKIEGGTFTGGLTVGANGNAVLSGGTFGSIKVEGTVNDTARTVSDLLAEGYGYWCVYSEGVGNSWATETERGGNTLGGSGSSISSITVRQLPATTVTFAEGSGSPITYGSTITLAAAVKDWAGTTLVPTSYAWHMDGNEAAITGATESTYTTPDTLAVGTHTFICKATVEGHVSISNTVTVTVNQATLTPSDSGASAPSYTAPTANSLTYSGAAQALVTAGTITPENTGCTVYYRLGETNTFTENIPKETNAGTYTVQWYINGGTNYTGVGSANAPKSLTVTIAPMRVVVSAVDYEGKTYDGTTDIDSSAITVTLSRVDNSTGITGLDPTVSDARFNLSGAGWQLYTATVTLPENTTNYAFATTGHNGGSYDSKTTVHLLGTARISPCPLSELPTAVADPVSLQQDVSVHTGSYPARNNVTLPEISNLNLDNELRFALGALPDTRVQAQIGGDTGMLTYTITGGKSGDTFFIPVKVTMPNFVKAATPSENVPSTQSLTNDTPTEEPSEEQPVTLTFMVQIKLTGDSGSGSGGNGGSGSGGNGGSGSGGNGGSGGGHTPIHRPAIGGGSNGGGTTAGSSSSGSGTVSGSGVASPGTGDAGVAVYTMLLLSAALGCCATGCAVFSRKRRRG